MTTTSQKQTEQAGARTARTLKKGDVVALTGELGAGKTAFVRGALRELGYEGEVTSPTFAIMNEYRIGGLVAVHADVYRIDGEEQLYSSGFYDYLKDAIMFVEWSDRIPFALPEKRVNVSIKGTADEAREITVEDNR